MPLSPRYLVLLLLPLAAAVAGDTKIADDRPIINFRLPTFTPEGFRSWLVRGTEARRAGPNEIDVRELTLTIFSGLADGKIETMILSPSARLRPADGVVTSDSTIRVINDQFEASGTGWLYAHKEKKVSIARNVRVTFRAEIKDILK